MRAQRGSRRSMRWRAAITHREELRRKLLEKGYDREVVAGVIDRLATSNCSMIAATWIIS
jgi:SOS response regulatory protein OraA/RecX